MKMNLSRRGRNMVYIYCDESCHLEHDHAKAMLLGAVSCPEAEKDRIYSDIRAIKEKHGLSSWLEIGRASCRERV